MLDLIVMRSGSGLSHKPYIKPSARHIPLSPDSSHHPAIHSAWPIAEINRMRARSVKLSDFHHFRYIKVQRFGECFISPAVLEKCMRFTPKINMLNVVSCSDASQSNMVGAVISSADCAGPASQSNMVGAISSANCSDPVRHLYTPIHWNHTHGPSLSKEIHKISDLWQQHLREKYHLNIAVKISWKNPGPPLFAIIRRREVQ